MADPARKIDPDIEPDIRPDLRAIPGGGQTTPQRASLRVVNNREMNPDKPSTASVPEREATASNVIRGPWQDNTEPEENIKKKPGFIMRVFRNHRWLTGAGVGVGLISIPVLLLSLLPLKLEMFIKNITEISVTVPGTAIDIRLEEIIIRALATRAIMAANPGDPEAGLIFCKGGGIACSLFTTYTTEYYEKKLGITFKAEVDGRVEIGGRASKWTVIQPGETDLDGVVKKIEVGSNKEMKKIIKEHVNTHAKHHSWIDRYVTRKLIQKRLGVVWWRGPPFVEKAVNKYETAKANIKTAIVKATLGRVAPRLATYLTCMTGDIEVCKKLRTAYSSTASTVPKNPDDVEGVDKDSAQYKADKAEYDAKVKAASGIGDVKVGADVPEGPIKGFITKRILAFAGGGVAIAGVLDLIFGAIESLDEGALEQIWYDMSTQVYMGFSAEIITAYEKWKAGDMDLGTLEVLNELFNNAEKAPLEQAENGGLTDTSKGVTTKCAGVDGVDGEEVNTTLKPGQLVCDEQKIVRDYSSAFTDNPVWKVLAEVAPIWNGTVGVGFDFVNGVTGAFLGAIPGFNQLMGLVGGLAEPLITWMIGLVFEPPLVGTEATGPQNYTALSAGIRATQNSTMEEGVNDDGTAGGGGGGVLTDPEVSAIYTKAEKENKEYFDNQPLLARIFSLDLSGSFAQKFISQLPTSISSLARLPMASLGQVFSGTSASAANTSTAALNPFGMPIYGYALNDPVLHADPSTYTEEYCKASAAERAASYSKEDGDIVPVYHKSDPCALEKLVVGSALTAEGVTDDKYSLKPLETEPLETVGGAAGADSSSLAVVVNKQHPNVPLNYAPTDLVSVGGDIKMRSEAAAAFKTMQAAGNAAGKTLLDPVSGYRSYDTQVGTYASWVESDGSAAIADTHSARPGYSEHQTGLAIDIHTGIDETFSTTESGKWLAANSWKYGFVLRFPSDKKAVTGYRFEPWHYRYIGVQAATDMHDKGITTLEEYYKVTGGEVYAYAPTSTSKLLSSLLKTQNNLVVSSLHSTSISMEPWLI